MAQVTCAEPSAALPTENVALPGTGTILDSWRSNMVVYESVFYDNTSGGAQTIRPTTTAFESGRIGINFTPFYVQILGDNSFVVLAVGDTRVSANLGTNVNDFSDSPQCFVLPAGARLSIGFLDALPSGGSSVASTVRWTNGGEEFWYTGGPGADQSGSVVVGQPPIPGARTLTNLRRQYHLDYQFTVD